MAKNTAIVFSANNLAGVARFHFAGWARLRELLICSQSAGFIIIMSGFRFSAQTGSHPIDFLR